LNTYLLTYLLTYSAEHDAGKQSLHADQLALAATITLPVLTSAASITGPPGIPEGNSKKFPGIWPFLNSCENFREFSGNTIFFVFFTHFYAGDRLNCRFQFKQTYQQIEM